jgi:DNA-binding MarR family transcriptional regulator
MIGAMPTRVDSGPLASELRVVLGHLIRRLRTEHRFSLSQGSVLGRLDREGPQNTSKLAELERVRPQSMGQTVAELETQGLIERHPDPADGRRSLIELTEAGRTELHEDRARREGWLAEAIEGNLSDEERERLDEAVRLLARLAEL